MDSALNHWATLTREERRVLLSDIKRAEMLKIGAAFRAAKESGTIKVIG
jgi:hypothetical protein